MHKQLAFSFVVASSLLAIDTPSQYPSYGKGPRTIPSVETKVPVEVNGKVEFESIPAGEPFLTGPLLCPSGHTVPYGQINLEPYIFINNAVGFYNNHWHIQRFSSPQESVNLQYFVQCGISDFMDLTFLPQVFYNYTGSRDNWRYGDFYMATGFQLYSSRFDSWLPTTRISFGELFPTGEYDLLDFSQLGTDVGGGGSFVTSGRIVMSDMWYFGRHHFLSLRWSNTFAFCTSVSVNGVNAYGGDPTTKGTVKPGWIFNSIIGSEFTLTKHVALALDINFLYAAETKFSGKTLAFVGKNAPTYLLSFAPAIEYNFNVNMGIIGGIWLSAFGLEAPDFCNGVIAFNWYFP